MGAITLSTRQVKLSENEVNELPPGHYVKVTVRDTGNGMPPEVAAQAVEPFFTTKEVGKGTGLGLSQVYGTIKQFSGEMEIETAVNKGTAVSLFLPALEGSSDERPVALTAGNEKALVVDDQSDVLDVTIELFCSRGYDVLSANNGESALEILKKTPDIDVLLSDIIMPGMSGTELARKARSLIPGIKVILASRYALMEPGAGNNAAADDFKFIKKPYRISEIAKMLRMAG